jgi:hypothetical protein
MARYMMSTPEPEGPEVGAARQAPQRKKVAQMGYS